jgi:hypothetical protein
MKVHKLQAHRVSLRDDFDTKLREIGVVAHLIAVANPEAIDVDHLNDAGYLLLQLLEDAIKLRDEIRKGGGS